MEPAVSCRVIKLSVNGRPESDAGRIHELSTFTHYCVSKTTLAKVKKMLAKLEADAADALDVYDDELFNTADNEANGIKYTLQTLGIRLT